VFAARAVAKRRRPSTLQAPLWEVSGFLLLALRSRCSLTICHGGLYSWPRRFGVVSRCSYGLTDDGYGHAFSRIMSIGSAFFARSKAAVLLHRGRERLVRQRTGLVIGGVFSAIAALVAAIAFALLDDRLGFRAPVG